MRISSSSFYTASVSGMLDQQSAIAKLSQQIASGNRLTSAADDPVSATQAMSLNERIAETTKYLANMKSLALTQSEESTVLDQLRQDLTSARDMLSSLGGGSPGADLRTSAAATIAGLYTDIKSLANHQDSAGNYIFAGYQTSTQPFGHTAVFGSATPTSGTSTYLGDSGLRQIQIGQGQTVQANDSLQSVMQSGTAADLLQNLDQIATDLQNNSATLPTSVANVSQIITAAMSSLENIQASLASRQGQVNNQQNAINQLLTANQNALSNLTAVDQASAIVELQTRQTSLQAAESAFSQISKLSVFNYL
jgi:flagellar hook-associated protein 3 FlgL